MKNLRAVAILILVMPLALGVSSCDAHDNLLTTLGLNDSTAANQEQTTSADQSDVIKQRDMNDPQTCQRPSTLTVGDTVLKLEYVKGCSFYSTKVNGVFTLCKGCDEGHELVGICLTDNKDSECRYVVSRLGCSL